MVRVSVAGARAGWSGLLVIAVMCAVAAGCGDDGSSGGGGTSNNSGTNAADAGDVGSDTPSGDSGGEVTIAPGDVRINEVAAAGSPSDWFEVVNTTDRDLDLSAVYFTDDLSGNPQRSLFPEGTVVPAGGHAAIYMDDSFPGFGLANDEELALVDADGRILDSVDWADNQSPPGGSYGRIPDAIGDFKILTSPTPSAANTDNPGGAECGNDEQEEGEGCDDGNLDDGDGCSGRCMPETIPVCGNDEVEGDEECDDGNRTPNDGCDPNCQLEPTLAAVRINEIVAQAEDGGPDWVELFNSGDAPVDLGGWFFSDDDPSHIAVIPDGTTLAAGGFVVFDQGEPPGGVFTFGLGGGDSVLLYNADGDLIDRTSWEQGDAPAGASWGRRDDGDGPFETRQPITRGSSNTP